MAFSDDTLNFLFENRVMDSKLWFEEHREQYETLVLTPMRELVKALTPAMLEIDPMLICEPKIGKCISRIYRDTRFSKDKRLFRDVMWVSFFRHRQLYNGLPCFFFELSPRGLVWGCGYYQTSPEVMEEIRKMILAEDADFLAAEKVLARRQDFVLADSRYKRSRHPDAPEERRLWLDQRSVCALKRSADFDLLSSPALPEVLAKDFADMKPLYDFLMKAELRKPKKDAGGLGR